eukprot:gene14464-20478_t
MHPSDKSRPDLPVEPLGIEFANWYLLSKLGEPSAPLLRSTLVKLGPAFVKIGQAVSSRPDLMSPEFLTELEKLQDRIPAYPSEDAYQMLENELGAPVNTIFASLSPEPVAAASLGQVYFTTMTFPSDDAYQMLENELGAPVNTIFASLSPEPVAAASLGQNELGAPVNTIFASLSPEPVAAASLVQNELGAPVNTIFASLLPEPVAAASLGQNELGAPVNTIFASLLPEPVAAASLGQFPTELEKLQDRIPANPSEDAYQMLKNELGAPVNTNFASRWLRLLWASVAGGQEVAVKVQRPGVVEMIAMDVYIMRYMAAVLRKIGKLNTDLPTVVDEWATSLFKELDYTREAANARRFKTLFARMPEVLTMEWVDGERLRSASSEERIDSALGNQDDLDLVEVGVRCSLEQMLEEGFYHADPHPGNLLRMPDGRLCYLDFGMMGETSLEIRQGLVRATLHLVNKEYESLADDFITLGFLPPDSDKSRIIPALTGVFQAALSGGVGNLSFSDLGVNLGRTMYQYKFQLPSYFTLLFRSLSVLEGIALASDPQYKVLSAAYPWVARRLLTDKSPALNNTLQALLYKEGDVFQFERLQGLLEQAAKMKALRLAAPRQGYEAAPTTPGTLSSGMPADASPLRLLLSEDGAFVRGILLEELAKSVDGFGRLTVDTSIYTGRKRAAVAGSFANFPLAWPVLTLLPSRNYPPLPLPWPWDGVALAWSTAFGQGGSRGSSNGDPDPGVALREYFFASEKEEGKSGNSSGGRTPQPNSKGGTDIVTIDAVVTPLTYDSPSPSGPVMRQLGPDGPKPSPKPASAPPQPPQTGADDTYSGRALGPTPTRPTESSSLASGPPSSGSG